MSQVRIITMHWYLKVSTAHVQTFTSFSPNSRNPDISVTITSPHMHLIIMELIYDTTGDVPYISNGFHILQK